MTERNLSVPYLFQGNAGKCFDCLEKLNKGDIVQREGVNVSPVYAAIILHHWQCAEGCCVICLEKTDELTVPFSDHWFAHQSCLFESGEEE